MSIEQAQQNGAGEKAASANRSGSALANGAHVAALTGDYILEAMHAAAAGDASKPQAEPPAEDFDTTPAPAMQHKAAMREITARLEQCGRYAGFPSVTHIADGRELQTASVQLAKALIPSDRQIMRLKGLEIIGWGGDKDSVSYTLRCCEPSTLDDENEVAKLRFELDKTRRDLEAERNRVRPFNEADAQSAALKARIDALEAENAALRAKPAAHTPIIKVEPALMHDTLIRFVAGNIGKTEQARKHAATLQDMVVDGWIIASETYYGEGEALTHVCRMQRQIAIAQPKEDAA